MYPKFLRPPYLFTSASGLWPINSISAKFHAYTKSVLFVFAWLLVAVIGGLFVGIGSVILPPSGVFGIVAIPTLVLLWALPNLPRVDLIWVRRLFYITVIVYLCVPFYYTIQITSLPWISARRVVAIPLIITSALTIAGSADVRRRLVDVALQSRAIIFPALAFYVSMLISIPFSINPPGSIGQFTESTLTWFLPLLTAIQIIEKDDEIHKLVTVLSTCAVVISIFGLIEFIFQHRFLPDIFPRWMLDKLIEDNPTLVDLLYDAPLRNGLYRAASVYAVSLSFGEYESLMAPFGLYFSFHGANWRWRTFGVVVFVFACAGIFASGSRGGYMSLLLGSAMFVILFTIWSAKFRPASLAPAISIVSGVCIFGALLVLIIFWQRAHNLVFGDGMAAYSTDGRYQQWDLAIPQILKNPLFGQGFAQGATIVDFRTPGGNLTIDSYVIALLTETGIFGFVSFAMLVVMTIFISIKLYLRADSAINRMAGAFACSMFAFGFYRLALAQRENHIVVFIFFGIVAVIYQKLSASRAGAGSGGVVAGAGGGAG